VKTGIYSLAVLAVGLMPSTNHFIPKQTTVSYGEYAEMNTQTVIKSNSSINEKEQSEVLLSFAERLSENTIDLDKDIAQIISNDFWEMYD
jgi:hypothetical protein